MPVVKSKEQVTQLLQTKRGGVKKPILFATEIEALKKGEGTALFISTEEWAAKLKTSLPAYYWSRYSKNKEVKTISISKVEGGHLITKL